MGDIQIATRRFCRALGFSDASAVHAILGLSDCAHTLLIVNDYPATFRLSALKRPGECALLAEIRYLDRRGGRTPRSKFLRFPAQRAQTRPAA